MTNEKSDTMKIPPEGVAAGVLSGRNAERDNILAFWASNKIATSPIPAAPIRPSKPLPTIKETFTKVRRIEASGGKVPDGIQPRFVRILAAIAWFELVAGIDLPTRAMVAARAGVSSTSSSYANDLSAMKKAGLIGYPSTACLCRTDEGRRVPVDVNGDVWDSIGNIVDPRHVVMLKALRKGAMTRAELAEAVGASVTSSSFANDLSYLRTLAMIGYPGKGSVELAVWLKSGGGAA